MKKRDCEKNLFVYKFVKLAADPARTGQARRGLSIPRFAGLTALSMWNGLSGHAVASVMRAVRAGGGAISNIFGKT